VYLESIPEVAELMPQLTIAEPESERRRALELEATTAPSRHERMRARNALAAEHDRDEEDDDLL
jgi:hypothetical protein